MSKKYTRSTLILLILMAGSQMQAQELTAQELAIAKAEQEMNQAWQDMLVIQDQVFKAEAKLNDPNAIETKAEIKKEIDRLRAEVEKAEENFQNINRQLLKLKEGPPKKPVPRYTSVKHNSDEPLPPMRMFHGYPYILGGDNVYRPQKEAEPAAEPQSSCAPCPPCSQSAAEIETISGAQSPQQQNQEEKKAVTEESISEYYKQLRVYMQTHDDLSYAISVAEKIKEKLKTITDNPNHTQEELDHVKQELEIANNETTQAQGKYFSARHKWDEYRTQNPELIDYMK